MKTKKIIFLIVIMVAIVAIFVVAGGVYRGSVRLRSGIYLVLSRLTSTRTPDGQFLSRCQNALFRWRLGSNEAPKEIYVDDGGMDCINFSVSEDKILARGLGSIKALDLLGKNVSVPGSETSMLVSKNGIHVYSTGAQVYPTVYTIKDAHGSILRVTDFSKFNLKMAGYIGPLAISDDGSTIYLTQFVEQDGWNGPRPLWTYDWKNDSLREITAVRQDDFDNLNASQFDLSAKRLIGVSNVQKPSTEENGYESEPPSTIHAVDLVTGKDTVLQHDENGVFETPTLSPDEKSYIASFSDGKLIHAMMSSPKIDDNFVGTVKDWVGNMVILDRVGTLVLHNLSTKKETSLINDGASYQYVGRIDLK